MTSPWLVLGQGRIGQLLAAALEQDGILVGRSDINGWRRAVDCHAGWVLLSLNRGVDSVEVADHLSASDARPRIHGVVDLTTQSLETADHCTTILERAGIVYLAGGLTGGAGGIQARQAVFLLGPVPVPDAVTVALEPIGEIIQFPDPLTGVAGKLIHNYVLLANSHALAVAIAEGERLGCLESMIRSIETGPAGRATLHQSIVRDRMGRGETSYSVRLVRKDLVQLRASLHYLPPAGTALLAAVTQLMADHQNDAPFTLAMVDGVRRERATDHTREGT